MSNAETTQKPLHCQAPELPLGQTPAAPFESVCRTVELSTGPIHLHEAGQGPLLLLIHGGAPGAYGMGNFGQNLPGLSQHFRTVVVDLPGYGGSAPVETPEGRYKSYALVFRELITELGYASSYVLGMATGGGVATALAAEFPEMVEKLVLVSAGGGFSLFATAPTEGQRVIQAYYKGEGASREKMETYMKVVVANPDSVPESVRESRYQMSLSAPAREAGVGRDVVWDYLPRIEASTLVMWGRDNRIQGYDSGLSMANRIKDSEFQLFSQCGLWVPWEKRERFESSLLAFLGSSDQQDNA